MPLAGTLLSLALLLLVSSPHDTHSSSIGTISLDPALASAFEDGGFESFLVLLKEQPEGGAPAGLTRSEARAAYYQARTQFTTAAQAGIRDVIGAAVGSGEALDATYLSIVNAVVVTGDETLAKALAGRSDVAAVLPSEVFRVDALTVAPASAPEANLQAIRAPQVWAMGLKGTGAVVGSIDTGVQWNHPALIRQYRGWNGSSANHNYNWADFEGHERSPVPFDDGDHGTHVLGITVGDDGSGNQVGVAPGARWIAAKACDSDGNCNSTDVLKAMEWMLAPRDLNGNNPDPAKAPDVVIGSFGSACANDELLMIYREALKTWREAGILGVFSGGNQGSVPKPGCYPEAIAVGATDNAGVVQSWSGQGPSVFGEIKPDLVAPGLAVRSTIPNSGYQYLSGASMAAPHVAGVAALLAGYSAVLTDDAIEFILTTTPIDRGPVGPDNAYGAGFLDAVNAITRVTAETQAPVIASFVLKDRGTGSSTATNETQVAVEIAATDDIAVAAYLLSMSASPPTATDSRWSAARPTTFQVSGGAGLKTVYAWAKDLAGNISPVASASILLDGTPPTASVSVPAIWRNPNIPVNVAASDNTAISGFLVSSVNVPPSETDGRWLAQAPQSIRLPAGDGVKRVFAWARDTAGNISSTALSTTVLDTLASSLTLSVPAITANATIAITLTASDASGVVGYYVSENAQPPAAATSVWSSTPPPTFTLSAREGRRAIFAWALDRAGNVSRRAAAYLVYDSRAPRPAIYQPRSGAQLGALRVLRGVTGDPVPSSGIATVRWALVRNGDCAWYDAGQAKLVAAACDAPVWNSAVVTGRFWYSQLRELREPGTYTLYVLATDRAGNVVPSPGIPGTSVGFSIGPAGTTGDQ